VRERKPAPHMAGGKKPGLFHDWAWRATNKHSEKWNVVIFQPGVTRRSAQKSSHLEKRASTLAYVPCLTLLEKRVVKLCTDHKTPEERKAHRQPL